MLFRTLAVHRLTGLRPTDLHDVPACRLRAEGVIETDDSVHVCPRQVQRLGNDRYEVRRDMAEPVLDLVENRQQCTRLAHVVREDVIDGRDGRNRRTGGQNEANLVRRRGKSQ